MATSGDVRSIPPARIPRATYRLQFNADFTFRDALALVPYLADLGISDVYASPILQATPGSTNGYDVCDPTRVNAELGTMEEFAAFAEALQSRDMGLLLDIVPNHMGIASTCNAWWMDVLENGPSARYAHYFDIDWQPVKAEIANKVLLPILGDHYGQALEDGALRLAYDKGAFWLQVYDATRLPLAPRTYRPLLRHGLTELRDALGAAHPDVQEVESIITALGHIAPPEQTAPALVAERYREKEVAKRRIAALYAASDVARAAINDTVRAYNGTPSEPASFDLLDDLIAQQSYRPAHWRVAAEEINYRRFFDVNTLAAIQVERDEVFEATHALIFRLLASGQVTGLRIDHPDGLWDAPRYFRQLQARYAQDQAHDGPLYVVVEKILTEREPLPRDWPVAGTTGYDFMNGVNDLLVARENEEEFTRIYQAFTGMDAPYAAVVTEAKRLIMNMSLNSEINALGHQLERITERNRRYRDYTLNSLIYALHGVIAHLQIYRTYTTGDLTVTERDQQYIAAAVQAARRDNQRITAAIYDFLEDTLLLRNLGQFREADRQAVVDFVMKFQQMTGPVMAKSVEDTAYYRYNRLVSLNEVGGNPEQFGASVTTFHQQNAARARDWPHSLLATSTHDTKRSEDVRARLDVLSEMPGEWEAAIQRWHEMNAPTLTQHGDEVYPSANDEYLLYQTLVGVWPEGDPTPEEWDVLRQRVMAYMEKAVQEAKLYASWINPNPAYLDAVRAIVAALLTPSEDNAFLRDFLPFQRHIAYFGRINSLAQTVLKLAAPGVPDFYQGTELWDFSLVDPDNRRQVDYAIRQQALADVQNLLGDDANRVQACRELLDTATDGRIKLACIAQALTLRQAQPDVFAHGAYHPLEARGACWQHICAFARQTADMTVLVIAPRLVVKLADGAERMPIGAEVWHDTWVTLPDDYAGRRYRNVFTGECLAVEEHDGVPSLSIADALAHFPVGLWCEERQDDADVVQ